MESTASSGKKETNKVREAESEAQGKRAEEVWFVKVRARGSLGVPIEWPQKYWDRAAAAVAGEAKAIEPRFVGSAEDFEIVLQLLDSVSCVVSVKCVCVCVRALVRNYTAVAGKIAKKKKSESVMNCGVTFSQ